MTNIIEINNNLKLSITSLDKNPVVQPCDKCRLTIDNLVNTFTQQLTQTEDFKRIRAQLGIMNQENINIEFQTTGFTITTRGQKPQFFTVQKQLCNNLVNLVDAIYKNCIAQHHRSNSDFSYYQAEHFSSNEPGERLNQEYQHSNFDNFFKDLSKGPDYSASINGSQDTRSKTLNSLLESAKKLATKFYINMDDTPEEQLKDLRNQLKKENSNQPDIQALIQEIDDFLNSNSNLNNSSSIEIPEENKSQRSEILLSLLHEAQNLTLNLNALFAHGKLDEIENQLMEQKQNASESDVIKINEALEDLKKLKKQANSPLFVIDKIQNIVNQKNNKKQNVSNNESSDQQKKNSSLLNITKIAFQGECNNITFSGAELDNKEKHNIHYKIQAVIARDAKTWVNEILKDELASIEALFKMLEEQNQNILNSKELENCLTNLLIMDYLFNAYLETKGNDDHIKELRAYGKKIAILRSALKDYFL